MASLMNKSLLKPMRTAAPQRVAMRSRRAIPTMAKRSELGESYAKALIDLASEKNKLQDIHSDVEAVAGLIEKNQGLTALLSNPVVEAEKKRSVLMAVGDKAQFDQYTNNFLNLLVVKDRLHLLDEICESFEEQYCKLTETQVANARSAVPLEPQQQQAIVAKLQSITGSKTVKLKVTIDPSVIAGFVVECGSSLLDLSVRGQIEKVSEELSLKAAASIV